MRTATLAVAVALLTATAQAQPNTAGLLSDRPLLTGALSGLEAQLAALEASKPSWVLPATLGGVGLATGAVSIPVAISLGGYSFLFALPFWVSAGVLVLSAAITAVVTAVQRNAAESAGRQLRATRERLERLRVLRPCTPAAAPDPILELSRF